MYDYDLIIIGGGSAGLTLASRAHKNNLKCCLINESNLLGGECLHTGCIPSKALIHSSERDSLDEVEGYIKKVQAMIQQHELPSSFKNIDFKKGKASFHDSHTILVDKEAITAKNFVIATGSSPRTLTFKGIDRVNVYTNETIFNNLKMKELVIIGGGAIGLEIAQALSNLNIKVTILEAGNTILPQLEPTMQKLIITQLKKSIKIVTNVTIKQYQDHHLEYEIDSKKHSIKTNHLLISIGRTSNTSYLNLNKAQVAVDQFNNIIVDQYLKSTQEHIFACGDVIGLPLFSHTAYLEGKIVFNNITNEQQKKINYDCLNAIIFIKPEVFILGQAFSTYQEGLLLTTKDIISDAQYCSSRFNELIEVLVDKEGYVLAAQAYGEGVGDYMHLISYLKMIKKPITSLEDMIFSYPSNIEILQKLVSQYQNIVKTK
ncbi:MAG: dihydrolipoyl dehydrogenase family protein [Bacilli bacterium]